MEQVVKIQLPPGSGYDDQADQFATPTTKSCHQKSKVPTALSVKLKLRHERTNGRTDRRRG